MADLRSFGSALERIGTGVSLMSSNPNNRAAGEKSLNAIREAEQDAATRKLNAEQEAAKISRQMKTKILETSVEAYQRPDLNEDQRFRIGTDIAILGKDLGIDVSPFLNLPQEAPEAGPKTLSPGAQLVGADGKVIAENKNVRTQTGEFERLAAIPPAERSPEQNARLQMLTTRPAARAPAGRAPTPSALGKAEQELSSLRQQAAAKPEDKALQARVARQEKYVERIAGGVTSANSTVNAASADEAIARYESSGDLNDLLDAASMRIKADTTTTADKSKRLSAVRNQAASVKAFRSTAERLSETLQADPTVITDPAKLAGFANEAAANVRGAANLAIRAFGAKVDPELGMNPEKYGVMRQIQTGSREVKTMILNLALAAAAAQGLGEGRDLSNADVQRAIDQMGGGSRDPAVILAGVDSAYQAMLERLESRALAESGELTIDTTPVARPAQGATGGWTVEEVR